MAAGLLLGCRSARNGAEDVQAMLDIMFVKMQKYKKWRRDCGRNIRKDKKRLIECARNDGHSPC